MNILAALPMILAAAFAVGALGVMSVRAERAPQPRRIRRRQSVADIRPR